MQDVVWHPGISPSVVATRKKNWKKWKKEKLLLVKTVLISMNHT